MYYRSLLYGLLTMVMGLKFTQYPPSVVYPSSTQVIAWTSPVHLDSVAIDLYQNSVYKQRLGQTNQKATLFNWHVSDTAHTGKYYFVKVTGISNSNGTAWANSPLFSIELSQSQQRTGYIVGGILILFILVCCVYFMRRNRTVYNKQLTTPFAATYPPQAVPINPMNNNPPIYYRQQQGYSGTAVAGGVAAGVISGIVLDEAIHSGRHHHSSNFGGGEFGGGGEYTGSSDFGGGDFGGGDFGGGGTAGDSSDFS